jgi:hypothetical protein
MTAYSYDQAAKAALRSAITSHQGWPAMREKYGVSSAGLSVELMEKIAAELSPPIDLSAIGKPRSRKPWGNRGYDGTPKPRPYGPEVYSELMTRRERLLLVGDKAALFTDIMTTVRTKQEYRLTEAQYRTLTNILDKAEFGLETPPAPKPAPQQDETPKGNDDMKDGIPFDQQPGYLEWKRKHEAELENGGLGLDEDDEETLRRLLAKRKQGLSEARVIELVKEHAGKPSHVTLDLRTPAGVTPKGEALIHYRLPLLLSAMNAGVSMMLVGPAGSGKTTACQQAAELLGRGFEFTGAINSEYKLTGFIDAQGRVVSSAFRRAFIDGAVFLFDEMDGSLPGAVLPFNSANANRVMDFPDGTHKANEQYLGLAACNTFGRGADRQYVGRYQQDAAVLDRFAVMEWPYDPALEAAMIGAPKPYNAPEPVSISPITDEGTALREAARWLTHVQNMREKIEKAKLRHIVSPRATVTGAKLLAAGWPWKEVEEAVIFKGLDTDSRAKLSA